MRRLQIVQAFVDFGLSQVIEDLAPVGVPPCFARQQIADVDASVRPDHVVRNVASLQESAQELARDAQHPHANHRCELRGVSAGLARASLHRCALLLQLGKSVAVE